MKECGDIAILGGGPAGLTAGYYARKAGIPFTIYEASVRLGGNCVTFEHDDFLFDSGAHRFHDKDALATEEIKTLLGSELKKINIPSQIYDRGKLVDFPLSPLNLIKNLGPFTFLKAAFEVIGSRVWSKKTNNNRKKKDNSIHSQDFESFALQTYGPTLARRFLLNYSEKLWGTPCSNLSPDIAGKRMKGLNLKTFIKEVFLGSKAKTEHLDGSFYYPDHGIGTICDKLARFCRPENICTKAAVTGIFHDSRRISAIEIEGREKINLSKGAKASRVVSTLPLDVLLHIMKPAPPEEILQIVKNLRYRNVILMVFLLNKDRITKAATIYFPEKDFAFSRLYEPKNRSSIMTPKDKTSLVLEIPCSPEDSLWQMEDDRLSRRVLSQFLKTGLIKKDDIIDRLVFRMKDAYPVLTAGYKEKVEKILNYLQTFENLVISGRNGKFVYAHLHDMMVFAREIINSSD
ncbi:FAD-dependent oxidoreductase [Acidobacteriota bacterium]